MVRACVVCTLEQLFRHVHYMYAHHTHIGGIAVTMVGHPFDTLKIRLQTQPIDKPIYSMHACGERVGGAQETHDCMHSHTDGMIDCARKTIQWEGVGGLYKV